MGRRKIIKPAETSAGSKNTGNSETGDILRDTAVMKMLESADRQYKDGKAIPLSKIMSDLGFEEDEL